MPETGKVVNGRKALNGSHRCVAVRAFPCFACLPGLYQAARQPARAGLKAGLKGFVFRAILRYTAAKLSGVIRQFDFETPPPAFNGETRFRLCLRGGWRRFALVPPEYFQC
jgi:hypothetical protein